MFPGAELHALNMSEKGERSAKEGGGNSGFHMTGIGTCRKIYFNLLLNKESIGTPGKWVQLQQLNLMS